MKTLNIDSPVGKRLAQTALFERLQAYFNLHPQKLVRAIKSRAKQNDLGISHHVLAINLKSRARMWLKFLLGMVALNVKSRGDLNRADLSIIVNDESALSLCKYLDWYPDKLLKHIKARAKVEGLTSSEFADYLVAEVPPMVDWAFDQAIEILKRENK